MDSRARKEPFAVLYTFTEVEDVVELSSDDRNSLLDYHLLVKSSIG